MEYGALNGIKSEEKVVAIIWQYGFEVFSGAILCKASIISKELGIDPTSALHR